jgi:hypothetical protein
MRRPHERLMELCSLCRHRRPPKYPPSALSATADPSTRPASASSSRWRSPGVLIWIFDSGRCLATRPAEIRCSRSGASKGGSPIDDRGRDPLRVIYGEPLRIRVQ